MTDVNEEIVAIYFELNGYLVRKNLKYMIKKPKSSGESDIDLAIQHPQTGDKAIVEVKGWHNDVLSINDFKTSNKEDYKSRLFHFLRKEALKKAEEFFKSKDFRKILVVPALAKNAEKRKAILDYVKKDKGVDIIEFKDIIREVLDKTEINKNYKDSEFQQTIRLVKLYGLSKDR